MIACVDVGYHDPHAIAACVVFVAIEILRGASQSSLYITAVGIDPAIAAEHIRTMHGEHRIPTLLAYVDRLSRATSS